MEKSQVGLIVLAAVAIIVGLALWPAMSSNIGTMTKTITLNGLNADGKFVQNHTVAIPANGTTVDLVGQTLLSTPVVSFTANGSIITAPNYTIAEGISTTTGYKTVRLTGVAFPAVVQGLSVNISYIYGPQGYVEDSAGRGIVALIAVFMALLIVAAASPNLREWIGGVFS